MEGLNRKGVEYRAKHRKSLPLLGVTILLVDDSRYVSEAYRLLALKSGARLRRADCIKSARRHLKLYRPNVVIIDLGLPRGGCLSLVSELSAQSAARPSIIVTGDADDRGRQLRARALGADAFSKKPMIDIALFQQEVLSILPVAEMGLRFHPRLIGCEVEPDYKAFLEDIKRIMELLEKPASANASKLQLYCTRFLMTLARMAQDEELMHASLALNNRLKEGHLGHAKKLDLMTVLAHRLHPPKPSSKTVIELDSISK